MEISEEGQNLKIELHDTKRYLPSNSITPFSPRNHKNEEKSSNNKRKMGQYYFTPLECFFLNKKMPRGFKFEIEDNVIKSLEQNKNQTKRVKGAGGHGEHQKHVKLVKNIKNEDKNSNLHKEYSPNNNKKTKKVVPKDNSSYLSSKLSKATAKNQGGNNLIGKNENNINNNSESYKIMMKCYSGFNKIKSNPNSKDFYYSKIPNTPSLSNIEKKIKNFEYKTVNEFCDDLRQLWNYQFKSHAKEPNIYQNICKLNYLSDQIRKELSNENINENKKEEIINIKKRTEKIKKDLDEIKGSNHTDGYNKNNRQKNMEDIYHLGRLIRSLNKPQLKGIVRVLSDNNESQSVKAFEFDLEQLSPEKYKNLKEYVENCYYRDKNHNSNIYKKNTQIIGLDEEINQAENNNNNESHSNKNNNNEVSLCGINTDLNMNIKDKNNNNQLTIEKEEKKEDKKSLSDSDSLSSDSSLSN